MTSYITVCHVCHLTCNVKMYCIKKMELREIYKKVTTRVYTGQEPVILCYICHYQLQRCYAFSEMSCKAEKILTDLSINGIKVTENIARMLDLGMLKNLTITMSNVFCIKSAMNIKEEEEEEKVKYVCRMAIDIKPFDTSVCRVCLVGNARAYCIRATGLHEIFENVTGLKLSNEDGRPQAICYICLAQLKRCFNFLKISQKVKQENESAMMTKTDMLLLDLKHIHNLSLELPQFMSCEEHVKAPYIIKEEPKDPNESIARVKKEVNNFDQSKMNSKANSAFKRLQTGLKKHFENHPCNQCYKVFRTKTNLTAHIKSHSNIYICDICKKLYKHKHKLIDHLKTHGFGKPCKCPHCPMTFVTKSSMYMHKRRRHDHGKRYNCPECDKLFHTISQVKTHRLSHGGIKPYVCDVCEKGFVAKANLVRHLAIHLAAEQKPHKCELCLKTFSDRSVMLRHKSTHYGIQRKKSFECNQCNLKFCTQDNLLTHIRRQHTGARPYSCRICSKAFANTKCLNGHAKFCKYMKCKECDRTFFNKRSLLRHLRDHTKQNGRTKRTCEVCNKAVVGLSQHLKTHSGERLYGCSYCHMKLATSSGLKRHVRNIHQKPRIPCTLCDLTFTQQKYLDKHMKAHQSSRQHVCSLCKREFFINKYLQQHMKRFHKIVVEAKKTPSRPLHGRQKKKMEYIEDTPDSDSEY